MDGKRGVADIRFSERPEVQGVMADVGSGVIRIVSAGYTVQKWEVSKRADGTRIKTATRWTPVEVSFTPLAADAGAQTRGKTMNEQLQIQIRSLVELSGLPAEFGEGLITRNVATIEEARTAVFTEAASRNPVIQHQAPAIVTREAAPDETLRSMGEALYYARESRGGSRRTGAAVGGAPYGGHGARTDAGSRSFHLWQRRGSHHALSGDYQRLFVAAFERRQQDVAGALSGGTERHQDRSAGVPR